MGGWKVSVERSQRTIAVVPAKYERSNSRTLERSRATIKLQYATKLLSTMHVITYGHVIAN